MTVRRLAPAFLLAAASLAPVAVHAAGTQYWTLRTAADYGQAELDGVALGPDGALSAGPRIASVPLPGDPVTWAMLVEGDRTSLAVGPGGRVLTVRGSEVTTDSTGEGVALSLARGPDGALYAGTGPEGRIVRLDGRNRRTYFDSGQKYVWALAWVGRTLYAATGPGGKLFAIDGEGRGRVVLDARAAHLTALAPDGRGGVFVGAAGRGIVYHVDGAGRNRALYEAAEKEIKALAFDGAALYVAALTAAPLTFAANDAPEPGDGTGQRAVVYRIVPDSSVTLHWVAPQGLVFALAPGGDGTLWAATGSRAALYAIDARGRGTALWSEPDGQATALARSGSGEFVVATASPSRLLRVRPRGDDGLVRSPVLDAKKVARWGRLWSEGEGGGAAARARTRSGNTAEPDSTWSPWRATGGDGAVASPPARYLQWELAIAGDARVRAVTVAWGEVNQPPRIEDFIVYPVPGRFYEGELNVRREPVTQELPDGRRVQFNAEVPRRASADALPPWAQGIRPMTWKAADPNGDALSYRLAVRRAGESAWTPIAEGLTNALYAWDTTGWPDGSYAVRLTASDEDENAAGSGLDDELVASPVELDRTPPEITGLEATVADDVITVRGTGRDARTFVARVDVALDDGSWHAAAPDDGLWDGAREAFTVRLEGISRGDHLVRVRVTDALGNPATATRSVTIGR